MDLSKTHGTVKIVDKKSTPMQKINSGIGAFGEFRVYGGTKVEEKTEMVILNKEDDKRERFEVNGNVPVFEGDDVSISKVSGIPYYFENHSLAESGYISDGVEEVIKKNPVLPMYAFIYPLSFVSAFFAVVFALAITFPISFVFGLDSDSSAVENLMLSSLTIGFLIATFWIINKSSTTAERRKKALKKLSEFVSAKS